MTEHLQDAAHPLEAVFLRGVRPLLGHDNDPLVVQHGHRKHGYPGKGNIKTGVTAGPRSVPRALWQIWGVLHFRFALPPPVHKLHGLNCERCGDDIISVVSPAADHHQPIHLANDKHKAVLMGQTKHILLNTWMVTVAWDACSTLCPENGINKQNSGELKCFIFHQIYLVFKKENKRKKNSKIHSII